MALDRLRRAIRRTRPAPAFTLERQPDALPKTGLFAEPVRVASIRVLDPEEADGGRVTVAFLVEVRDSEDQRCSTLAVEARLRGPEREWVVSGNTDLMGRLKFRATGPSGEYAIEVLDVAAGGLQFDPTAGETRAATTVE
ncbi:MAG TPA: hypothetical protein VK906_17015 [Egicoccus sp.]|nr:hypothetical protein [Egicoccus sp.]HSK24889.1 hypothetical protein [Egicoccus sp.]